MAAFAQERISYKVPLMRTRAWMPLAAAVVAVLVGCGGGEDGPTTLSASKANEVDGFAGVAAGVCIVDPLEEVDATMRKIDLYIEQEDAVVTLLRDDPDALMPDGRTVRELAVDALGNMDAECVDRSGRRLQEALNELRAAQAEN